MDSPFFFPWLIGILAFGMACVFLLWNWSSWVGYPISILLVRLSVDAGIAPILRYKYGTGLLEITDATIVMPMANFEIPKASFLLLLGYGSILVGMMIIRFFPPNRTKIYDDQSEQNQDFMKRGFNASLTLFMVGAAINVFSIMIASRGLSLAEVASTRAAFTNEEAYGSAIFNYLWLIKSSMQIGALGLLIFSYRMKRYILFAWIANIAYILVQPIFGGRTALVQAGLAIALLYHHGIKRLGALTLAVIVCFTLAGLSYIAIVRHGHSSIKHAVVSSVAQLASSRAAEEVTFAVRAFPSKIPYFKGDTLIAGISHALPGYKAGDNLWRTLEDEFIGKWYQAKGIGGQTLSTTAESYMNFGFPGIIAIGLCAGLLFGLIYDWQRRNPDNPLLLIFTILVTLIFVVAIYKKCAIRVTDIPTKYLVPIGFLAVWASGTLRKLGFIMIAGWILIGLLLYKLTGIEVTKVISFIAIIVIYIFSCYTMQVAPHTKMPEDPIRSR